MSDVQEQREKTPGGITGKGFTPGRSGNPGGRPKGTSVTGYLNKILDEIHEVETGKTKSEIVARKIVDMAIAGDVRFTQILLDRTEGKVPDKVLMQADVTEVKPRIKVANRDGRRSRNGGSSPDSSDRVGGDADGTPDSGTSGDG